MLKAKFVACSHVVIFWKLEVIDQFIASQFPADAVTMVMVSCMWIRVSVALQKQLLLAR